MAYTKRLERMLAWIEKNPYEAYADHNDQLSDEMAQMLINGKFKEFDETWFEIEMRTSDYADWRYWERDFIEEFFPNLDDIDFDMLPRAIQEFATENRRISCDAMLKTMCDNWQGHVCARLIKRNGEVIEFPHYRVDSAENAYRQRYLKNHCGIDGWKAEATYPDTYLTVLGTIDLFSLLQAQIAPKKIRITSKDYMLGHEPFNGSGTCGDTTYCGKSRVMNAKFFVDGTHGYGIDSIFGLSRSCWYNSLNWKG